MKDEGKIRRKRRGKIESKRGKRMRKETRKGKKIYGKT